MGIELGSSTSNLFLVNKKNRAKIPISLRDVVYSLHKKFKAGFFPVKLLYSLLSLKMQAKETNTIR